MKIVGIVPARYHSTRFPGKALANLMGMPMICRVLDAAQKSGAMDAVFAATDSDEIEECCRCHGFSVIRTNSAHKNPTSRVQEAAKKADADLLVMIGGDEPLLSPEDIRLVIEKALFLYSSQGPDKRDFPFVVNAMTAVESIGEALDCSNIKIVCDKNGRGLYTSRAPVPYPKGSLHPPYRKFVSIGVYTKEALDFFVSTEPGELELTEECDLLRFLENGKAVYFVDIGRHTLSVDTPKDLEEVKGLIDPPSITL